MGIGAGIFLVAVGAILKYAVADEVEGVDLSTIGVILMIAGIAIALFAAFFYLAGRDRGGDRRVVEERYERTPRDPL